MGHHGLAVWLGFSALVVALLAIDLGVLNRRAHVLTFKEALTWSLGLIGFALVFGLFVLAREGGRPALEYYTGYLIELSLSVDNLFVFILIFGYFNVPPAAQPTVLKWGILGAIGMRFCMIALGAVLLREFEWITWVFGGILVLTGIRMWTQKQERVELARNPVVRLARACLPLSSSYDGSAFFTRTRQGRTVATPLFLVLLVIEWSDLVFAIDSIPAVFAVTRDPFLVFSSNVFAILGLRALFFVLAGMLDRFMYLRPGVALILVLVGVKMGLSHWLNVPTALSLGAIVTILGVAVLLSLWRGSEARQPT